MQARSTNKRTAFRSRSARLGQKAEEGEGMDMVAGLLSTKKRALKKQSFKSSQVHRL